MSLKLKTFVKQDTFGKQKAFFCAHPKDYIYFDEITDEILRIQNCAIFYKEDPKEEVNLDDLNEMSLFIMPVTSNLLYLENDARNLEFKYAMEHHIPVLPLQQEGGIESEFNKKCGDLQMLYKYQKDSTAISYEDKLKQFILSVLVGDEDRKKIQEAFDAYIFLSYRKKDRKYAQDLMKAIHNCDKCRDLAIWYDEFLVPGENFNSNIEEMMNKSKIFSLVVTPSLLEEGNYVQTVEYKNAKKSDIIIVPTEMKETDKNKLKEMYEDIPECSNPDNESLDKALKKACEGIALEENDSNVKHNYLIGLAYLGGVDVEKDYVRAFKILEECAKQEYIPAMEKMVEMYEQGLGVERNYDTAILWEEKVVNLIRKQYEESPNEDNARKLIAKLEIIGNEYYDLGKLFDAKKYFQELCELCKKWYKKDNKNYLKNIFSISNYNLGCISEEEEKFEEAKEYYLKGLEILETNENLLDEMEKEAFSLFYEGLGRVLQAQGKIDESKSYYLKSLKIREQLANELGTIESRQHLSIIYRFLGDNLQNEGNFDDAERFYLKSFEIIKKLAEETKDFNIKRELSISYEKLGDILSKKESTISESNEYYLKGIEFSEQIFKEMGTLDSKRELSISYERLSEVLRLEGKYEESKSYSLKSLEITEHLSKETNTRVARRDLAVNYNQLGDILESENNLAESKSYYLKGLAILEQLFEENETLELKNDLSINYSKLINILFMEGNLSESMRYSLKFSEILSKL